MLYPVIFVRGQKSVGFVALLKTLVVGGLVRFLNVPQNAVVVLLITFFEINLIK